MNLGLPSVLILSLIVDGDGQQGLVLSKWQNIARLNVYGAIDHDETQQSQHERCKGHALRLQYKETARPVVSCPLCTQDREENCTSARADAFQARQIQQRSPAKQTRPQAVAAAISLSRRPCH